MENFLPISGDEIPDGDLELPIRGCEYPYCSFFSLKYSEAAREVEVENPLLSKTYQTLSILCSYHPNFESRAEPYLPLWTFNGRRSAVPDDLTKEDLGVFPRLLERLTEPALRARILDVLWIRRNEFQSALQAVEAYILAAEKLLATDGWFYGVECLRRALQLASLLGRSNEGWQKVLDAFENFLRKPVENSHPNFANHLLGLAAEFGISDPVQLAALAIQHGEACSKIGEFEFARQYHQLAAGFFFRAKDSELTRAQI
jgi:hypothetical protein